MKMNEQDWTYVKHFTREEKWGDWQEVDRRVVIYLDMMRKVSGHPIVIHCAYETAGHTETSQHYHGRAVDFHIAGMTLLEQYLFAERFPWTGIGVYPDWNSPGLHCDVRTIDDYRGSRWGRNGTEYVPLDEAMIRRMIT